MTTLNHILIAIGSAVLLSTPGFATNFEFTGNHPTSDDWSYPQNWSPEGVPGDNDTATVPNGKFCEIGLSNVRVLRLTIHAGGTVQIIRRDLSVAQDSEASTLIVNGRLEFRKIGEARPRLVCQENRGLRIGGSGTVDASAAAGLGPAEIRADFLLEEVCIQFGQYGSQPKLTVRGTFRIIARLRNNATFLVEHADDVMEIGYVSSDTGLPWVLILGEDDGSFTVTAGSLRFGRTAPGPFNAKWIVDGGTLELTPYTVYTEWLEAVHAVDVRAGVLLLNNWLITLSGVTFSGGQIRLAPGLIAVFR